ncbi:linker histone H1 and H5 family protein [Ancylostoma ceylanicum]|uniref:Linker histone H1 and H5 family protein n=1 Tax=Ancylostoma ceylanicum TaxID=53326 RepID=A0A0D6LRM7_9BILA|nr:linker histone H1 and H5 family protein [Ancylostoma ceylanicum]
MIQAATAAMNMEGMLDASGVRPIEFRKLDEEGKKVLNKKNPVPGPHHPTYLTMIKGAVLALNEGKGASKPAILKYLAQHYQLGENLPKTKGHGASGSFKIAPAANSAKRSGRVMKKKLAKGKDVDEKKEVKAKTAAAKPKATMKKRVAKKSTGKAKAAKTVKKGSATKKKTAVVVKPRVQKKRGPAKSKAPRAKKT